MKPIPGEEAGLPAFYDTPFILPGVTQPFAFPADQADLADDARVIGVSAGGRHRAYSITAMSAVGNHVINDLFNDVPVTVTYCDYTDWSRVLTCQERGAPIDLWLGGRTGGEVSLRYQDNHYRHSGQDLPLDDHPYVVTTWKEWREAHPDTDVFLGWEPESPDDEPEQSPAAPQPDEPIAAPRPPAPSGS
ncbi:MAG TPA: DUF3179 domain-containing (seleno)protein [Planctomycetaceae bacterium]|nr:DUF3179 domain-containing (seleno)protein [Planctomycetaceae bacterium]